MNSPAGTALRWVLIFREQRIADRIRGWRLPESAEGKPITITFVFAVTVGS